MCVNWHFQLGRAHQVLLKKKKKKKKLDQDLLTLDEAAARYGVSRRTLERLRAKGMLPGIRFGRFLRVRMDNIERALSAQSPEQIYRVQINPNPSTGLAQWMRGWEQLAINNFSKPKDLAAAIQWISEIERAFSHVPIKELRVREVLESSAKIRKPADLKLLIDALGGIDPEASMLKVLRQLLPLIVPKL